MCVCAVGGGVRFGWLPPRVSTVFPPPVSLMPTFQPRHITHNRTTRRPLAFRRQQPETLAWIGLTAACHELRTQQNG